MSTNLDNPYEQLLCSFTGKLLNEAFIANDGYIYEKEYIESLYTDKDTFISPTTKQEIKKGGILFTKFNKILEEFYKNHSEMISLRYIPVKTITEIFNNMITTGSTSIIDIVNYVEKYNECKFVIDKASTYLHEIVNNKKGILLICNENITSNFSSNFLLIYYIIENSFICDLAFDYIIEKSKNVDRRVINGFFFTACYFGRYELVVKMYNFDNTLIHAVNGDKKDNVFHAAMYSDNLDIIKFLHSIDPLFYKTNPNINNKMITSFMYACTHCTIEIIEWFHSIDNKQYINDRSENVSLFEYVCCNPKSSMETIKYLFTIDKDIYNNDPNADNIIKNIKNSRRYINYKEIIKIIAEHI